MKKGLFILSVLLIGTSMFAQNKAKEVLDEITQKAKSYKNISIKFKRLFDNDKAKVHQESKGSVVLQGDLYYLKYMGTDQMYNGTKTYIILHENEDVVIQSSNEEEDNTITPSKLYQFYEKGYTYAMGKRKKEKGITVQYIVLTPIDKTSTIEQVLVGVIPKKKQLYNIIEKGKNGTTTTTEVTSFKINQPISKKLFIFDKNKYEKKNYTIVEAK